MRIEIEPYQDFLMRETVYFFRKTFQMLNFNGISREYVESGSHGAHTFPAAFHSSLVATHRVARHFWAFDSFRGLPESTTPEDEHPMWQRGHYQTSKEDFINKCIERGIPRELFQWFPGFSKTQMAIQPASQATCQKI